MNPFINPITGIPFIKDLIFAPKRLEKTKKLKMKKYRDRVFRNIVRYAYSIPIYYKKYREAGIHPYDISGINDANKLPFITKKDIVENFSKGIVPLDYDFKKGIITSTSGSTGKPISFYVGFPTLSRGVLLYLRLLYTFNFNWRHIRFVSIGNFSKGKADQVFEEGFIPYKTPKWAWKTLQPNFNPAFLRLMSEIKKMVDPHNIMNPGKLHF